GVGGRRPDGRSAVVATAPFPLAALQLPPGVAVHDQLAPVSGGGKVSLTGAPTTSLGPAFLTVMVYVSGAPGIASVWLSVLMMERSATSAVVPDTLLVSFAGLGSGSVPAVRLAGFGKGVSAGTR